MEELLNFLLVLQNLLLLLRHTLKLCHINALGNPNPCLIDYLV